MLLQKLSGLSWSYCSLCAKAGDFEVIVEQDTISHIGPIYNLRMVCVVCGRYNYNARLTFLQVEELIVVVKKMEVVANV